MLERGELEKKLGDLVAPAKPVSLTVTARAAKELQAALAEGGPGDVIHLTITPGWEHQLDLGPKEATHVTVDVRRRHRPARSRERRDAEGVQVDFVEGATGAGFKIDNPNRPPMVRRDRAERAQGADRRRQGQALYDVRTPNERETPRSARRRCSTTPRWPRSRRCRRTPPIGVLLPLRRPQPGRGRALPQAGLHDRLQPGRRHRRLVAASRSRPSRATDPIASRCADPPWSRCASRSPGLRRRGVRRRRRRPARRDADAGRRRTRRARSSIPSSRSISPAMTGVATITFGASTTPGASLESRRPRDRRVSPRTARRCVQGRAVGTEQLDLGPAGERPGARGRGGLSLDRSRGLHGRVGERLHADLAVLLRRTCSRATPNPPTARRSRSTSRTCPPARPRSTRRRSPTEAPAYQVAWAIDEYTQLDLGTTTAGTKISVWYRSAVAGEDAKAMTGTQHLVAAFDWLEQTLGPYRFGDHFGSISVGWPAGAFGGMEHHPFVHIGASAIAERGDQRPRGVARLVRRRHPHPVLGGLRALRGHGQLPRRRARSTSSRRASVRSVWSSYASQLQVIGGRLPVWPQSCGQIDVLKDNLFTQAPYMRGAFFYKGIADKLGDPGAARPRARHVLPGPRRR